MTVGRSGAQGRRSVGVLGGRPRSAAVHEAPLVAPA
jgi:hypothetical protein